MAEFLELQQILSALLGAVIALAAQAGARRYFRGRTGRRLCMAFWEELSATHFYGPDDKPNFAGFSSQTFDTLFHEAAQGLPESLARDLMRYHWRMKYMEEMKPHTQGSVNPAFWKTSKLLQAQLLTRLDAFARRKTISLFLWFGEGRKSMRLRDGNGAA